MSRIGSVFGCFCLKSALSEFREYIGDVIGFVQEFRLQTSSQLFCCLPCDTCRTCGPLSPKTCGYKPCMASM